MAYASCVFVSWGVASGNLSEFPLQNYQHGGNDSACERGRGGGGVCTLGDGVGWRRARECGRGVCRQKLRLMLVIF